MRPASAIHPDDLPRVGRSDYGVTSRGYAIVGKMRNRDGQVVDFFYDLGECSLAEAKSKMHECVLLAERFGVVWHEGPYLAFQHVTHSHWYSTENRFGGAAAPAPSAKGDRLPLVRVQREDDKDRDETSD